MFVGPVPTEHTEMFLGASTTKGPTYTFSASREIVDLRPLKDGGKFPDLRGCVGSNPTNTLMNMHDPSLREVWDRTVGAMRELANWARAARASPGDCLPLLGCNKGRHRPPLTVYLTTKWWQESHNIDVDYSHMASYVLEQGWGLHLPPEV